MKHDTVVIEEAVFHTDLAPLSFQKSILTLDPRTSAKDRLVKSDGAHNLNPQGLPLGDPNVMRRPVAPNIQFKPQFHLSFDRLDVPGRCR